ncbi:MULTISPECIES: type III secretion system outer membrane ring subunit SctC [Sphingobium]|uniref:Type 3 secretion system secretin n=1 Tax=Sphingobium limneticum TaxID=1007511 RepID=A0A5J5IAG0_9SPHN|nr:MULTISPECIES: type III secretion system outer membrane ring subunit SctC [Sphingobium]KAA9020119.1 EscC/YscC/HrcC family type III secretion system outer membrane ring protein [Sphingobium limneticum]KAA9021401.1 EscC/YscC/HrcC family type III secretion system outer membrane ring protein [Sphingobium limneticum]KAA9033763.1 EscC/YscC/HrcC family type III secretion system outer membrane ring protein [Sphingobium limneticum]BBD03226.1 type III secretion protein C [Sphingobium sp. YG1]
MKHVLASCAAAIALACIPVQAAEPPFGDKKVSLSARDQPATDFLNQFFAASGLRVAVAGTVTGKINGRFSGHPADIWRQVSSAFNLIAYYDGAVVTVYNANDVQSRTMTVASGRAADLSGAVSRGQLGDATNRVRITSAEAVMATGVPRFLDQVQQIASALPRTAVRQQPGSVAIAPGMVQQAPMTPGGIEPYELRVFYLRYARADDTTMNSGDRSVRVPGVATTVSRIMGDGQPIGSVTGSYGEQKVRQSAPRLMGRGLDSVRPGDSQSTPYDNDDEDYLGLPGGNGANQIVVEAPPRSGPRITVDPSLNAVIIRDRPENMPAYEGLVRSLDVAPQVVELEATIIDINVDKLRELGINWRFNSGDWGALFGGDVVRRTGNPLTDALISGTGQANRGLSLSGAIGASNELLFRINALEEKGAAKVVSRPQLMTLSNVEAVFDRTRTFYVRVAGDRQVDLFNVTAGTVLRVNPHVLVDGGQPRIRMVVHVEDGSLLDGTVDRIPVVERASVDTQALIAEGESLLLGGLTVNADADAESAIPVLGQIPIVGELFKTRTKKRQHIERLFLISPRINRMEMPGVASGAPGAEPTKLGAVTRVPQANNHREVLE